MEACTLVRSYVSKNRDRKLGILRLELRYLDGKVLQWKAEVHRRNEKFAF